MDSVISFIAQYGVFISVVIAVAVWLRLGRRQKWEFAIMAVLGGALALALLRLGSALYFDTRPFVTEHIAPLFPHPADNGFPSDHTLLAMFIAICTLFYSRTWGFVLMALAVAIGAARVAAHVHHPIDILGAIAFAVAAALLAHAAARWLARRWPLPWTRAGAAPPPEA